MQNTLKTPGRIIFNGNNYSDEWVAEAERRGLLNLKSTPEAISHFADEKNIKLFEKHGILTRDEVLSRSEISYENYSKVINIEALTMLEMARQDIIPAVTKYLKLLCDELSVKSSVCASASRTYEEKTIELLSSCLDEIYCNINKLDELVRAAHDIKSAKDKANFYHDKVLESMNEVRRIADIMEVHTAKEYWPFPSYGDLLFSIQE